MNATNDDKNLGLSHWQVSLRLHWLALIEVLLGGCALAGAWGLGSSAVAATLDFGSHGLGAKANPLEFVLRNPENYSVRFEVERPPKPFDILAGSVLSGVLAPKQQVTLRFGFEAPLQMTNHWFQWCDASLQVLLNGRATAEKVYLTALAYGVHVRNARKVRPALPFLVAKPLTAMTEVRWEFNAGPPALFRGDAPNLVPTDMPAGFKVRERLNFLRCLSQNRYLSVPVGRISYGLDEIMFPRVAPDDPCSRLLEVVSPPAPWQPAVWTNPGINLLVDQTSADPNRWARKVDGWSQKYYWFWDGHFLGHLQPVLAKGSFIISQAYEWTADYLQTDQGCAVWCPMEMEDGSSLIDRISKDVAFVNGKWKAGIFAAGQMDDFDLNQPAIDISRVADSPSSSVKLTRINTNTVLQQAPSPVGPWDDLDPTADVRELVVPVVGEGRFFRVRDR